MTNRRCTRCIVVALAAALLVLGGAAALEAADGQAGPAEFRRLVEAAADARGRGDLEGARARLREATLAVEPDRFHRKLVEAGEAYDRQDRQAARARLKSATWLVEPYLWFGLGFVAQLLFSARFVVQWIASERRGKSVFPMAFWYLSLSGSSLLLVYAIWQQDPVFTLGQSFNSIIYVRNLMLIFRERRRQAAAAGEDASE